jgi:hypothetical protein
MKLATFTLPALVLLGASASVWAADPAASSQVVLAFSGGSFMTSDTTGICMFYPVLLADLELKSLFASPLVTHAVVDKEHAYFIWVSDFSMLELPVNNDFPDFNFLAIVPAGTATIYYTDRPDLRDWRNLNDRSSWGQPVATFTRQAGLFHSADGGMTGPMFSTAVLLSSKDFNIGNKKYNFKDWMPNGMTCLEFGVGASEAGSCVAIGK